MMMAMLEYPLECISFASQVNSEMWRRNGNSALNMAFNYQSAPLCRAMRDMDLICIQLATIGVGGDDLKFNFLILKETSV